MAKRKTQELKVVFDTNPLWTRSPSDLVPDDVRAMIGENSSHQDLKITWYLPEIVRHERQYQLVKASLALLPSIQKLEGLLGHKLNITEEIIRGQVDALVEKQISALGLRVIGIENARVDWTALIRDSAYRIPPFSPGETEKGFRDALVVEAFMQLVAQSPVTPATCRIVLVSGDKLLVQAIEGRIQSAKNIQLVPSAEELKGLINTLASAVNEDFINKNKEVAETFFVSREAGGGFFHKGEVASKVAEEFSEKLYELPPGASTRINGEWRVFSPTFIEKKKQRFYWSSRIEIESNAYESGPTYFANSDFMIPANTPLTLQTSSIVTNLQKLPTVSYEVTDWVPQNSYVFKMPTQFRSPSQMSIGNLGKQNQIANGRTAFEVVWSVAIAMNGKFAHPKIESIRYIETLWY